MDLTNVKTIVVDIEGTITSISFVKDTLFPYVRDNISNYVTKKWEDPEFQEDLKLLKQENEADKSSGIEGCVLITDDKDSVVQNVLWQMSLDRKITGLKQLQGHMWRDGYSSGDLVSHIYPEVKDVFKLWNNGGRNVYIFSSGSTEAQKLLIKYSIDGDLSDDISGYFDTKIGSKIEKGSYEAIAKEIGRETREILFLTDVVKEANAAKDAGMKVVIVVREGNAPIDEEAKKELTLITSLDDLVFEPCAKRAKVEETNKTEANPENGVKLNIGSQNEEEMKEKIENGEKMEIGSQPEEEKMEKIENGEKLNIGSQPEEEKKEVENGEKMEIGSQPEEEKKEKIENGEKLNIGSQPEEENKEKIENGEKLDVGSPPEEENKEKIENDDAKPTNGNAKHVETDIKDDGEITNGNNETNVSKTVAAEKEAKTMPIPLPAE